ncbi:MAG TPA: murein biosynthesis integral membrane protein MurJ [Terriglobales bacterium]|jgi:putative peptidoglycan lipid II flippase
MTDSVPAQNKQSAASKLLRLFRPSHEHSAFSATLLLMSAIMMSRLLGFVREQYIAWAFGVTPMTDAYVAGFTIPEFLNYLIAGGAASITFIAIYTRFLAENKEGEAKKTFSVIITVMTSVLILGVVLAEIFAPPICRWLFKGFAPAEMDLCIHLTRLVLPSQLFFYVGGVISAVLVSRKLFLLPAFGPLLYNVFIILGGLLLSHRLGIASLAYGVLAGSFAGPFLVNAIGARRIGIGYRFSFEISNAGFREWVKLSIPLMLGFSLVTADDWILRHYASGSTGAISRLNYAKRLFGVPIAILGQAAGQASLPFFARLFSEKKLQEFGDTVNGSVYRIVASSLLVSSLLMVTVLPLVDLLYRHGHFRFTDSRETATYLFWFAISLAFWAAQALYARAFYAAGDTLTPMIASSLIVLGSLPVYSVLHQLYGTIGLAIASDVGIAANTLVTAMLLHRRKLVLGYELPWKELGKVLLTASVAMALGYHIAKLTTVSGSRMADLKALLFVGITWAGAVAAGLWLTRSQLLNDLRRRKATSYPRVAEQQARLNSEVEP